MTYPYIVKHDGVYYPAGAEVPTGNPPVKNIVSNDKPAQNTEEKLIKPTKTEITQMSTEKLQKLADSVGIENAFDTSGRKLKEKLIEYFGL